MTAILCGEEGKKVPAKGTWLNAAIVAGEGIHGVRGVMSMETIPETIRYVVICGGYIVGWQSFEEAGDPAKRLEIQLVHGVHAEIFLQQFAKLYGQEYVRLPYRGGAGYQCYHLAPVPDDLLELPPLMGFGGACSVYDQPYCPPSGQNGTLLGP